MRLWIQMPTTSGETNKEVDLDHYIDHSKAPYTEMSAVSATFKDFSWIR